nr:hypothetical protein [Catellatospora sichuanensis]
MTQTRVPISALRVAKNDSAAELSKQIPVLPIDGRILTAASFAA